MSGVKKQLLPLLTTELHGIQSSQGHSDYGGGQFQLSWDSEVVVESGTPMVSWVGLVVVDEEGVLSEATVGDSVNVEAEILNSGICSCIISTQL